MIAKIYPDGHPDLQSKRDPSHPVRYFDIRKLTEGECLRLMDVPEPDIIKLCTTNSLSRSAIYKLAGNSIVVSCLYHIFRNIWLGIDAFNILDISNVNSYYWVTDITNHQYAVPNYLTGRQINARLLFEF